MHHHQPTSSDLPVTVLVVDDDDDVRHLVRRWLADSDRFELVGEADNGPQAIETARRVEPQIIVMDIRLPRGDGSEATRIIGSLAPGTRVLAHTAMAEQRYVLEMIGAGVDGYLVKSGSAEEFLEALTVVADGGTFLSPTASEDVFDHVRSSARRRRCLQQALEPGAVQVAMQPIIAMASGDTVGYEALARFDHNDPGPVFAAAIVEGRELEMEVVAARAALHAVDELHRSTDFVCVNVSPQTVTEPQFRELLADADPDRTVLELTENAAVSDYPRLRAALEPLRNRGFRIAVDDVGGGFACLSHVHQLQPDMIKIDRYLVHEIDADPMRQIMVSALVAIAAGSRARLVGEGVETAAELETLRELGVELAQGFLLGVPELVAATARRAQRS